MQNQQNKGTYSFTKKWLQQMQTMSSDCIENQISSLGDITYNTECIVEQEVITNQIFEKVTQSFNVMYPRTLKLVGDKPYEYRVVMFKSLQHISFPHLRILKIHYRYLISLQPISFLSCPSLSQLELKTNKMFSSLHPISKCKFSQLKLLTIATYQNHFSMWRRTNEIIDQKFDVMVSKDYRNYDLLKLHRTKMCNTKNIPTQHQKTQDNQFRQMESLIFLFRHDMSNVRTLAKLELQYMPNFSIPYHQPHFKKVILNQNKMFQALSKKYRNKVIPRNCPDRNLKLIGFKKYGNVKDIYDHGDKTYLKFYNQNKFN